MMTVREKIEDAGYGEDEGIIIFDNPSYESAFVGVTEDNRAVYDYDKMVDDLVRLDGCTELDAMEFIDYNTIRALPYEDKPPIIVHNLSCTDDLPQITLEQADDWESMIINGDTVAENHRLTAQDVLEELSKQGIINYKLVLKESEED